MNALPLDLEGLTVSERPSRVTVSTQTSQEDAVAGDVDVEYINGKHPIRIGQPTCPYFGKKGGRCSFGRKCRYDHQPAAGAQKQDKQQHPEQPGTAVAPAAAGAALERPVHDRQLVPIPPIDGALAQAAMHAWPWRAGRRSFLKGVLAAHIIETAYMQSMETAEVHYRLNTAQAGPVLQEAWRHQQGRSTEARQKPYSTLGKLLDGDPYLSIEEDPTKPGCNWVVLDVARLQADYGTAAAGSGPAMMRGVAVMVASTAGSAAPSRPGAGAGVGFTAAYRAGPGPNAPSWVYRTADGSTGGRGYGTPAKGASGGHSSAYSSAAAELGAASGSAGPSASGYVLAGSGSSSSGMDSVHSHGAQMYPVGYGMAYGPAGGPYPVGYGAHAVVGMGAGSAHGPAGSSMAYGQQGRGSGSVMGLHPMHRGASRG